MYSFGAQAEFGHLALWAGFGSGSAFPAFSGLVGMVRWGPGALSTPAVSLGESAVRLHQGFLLGTCVS